MANQNRPALALLIDGDNVSPRIVGDLLSEIAKYGVASVKRVYGDWTKPQLSGWKDCFLEHAIQPIQQFAYTTGKNATDSAMIIDAMDLLYTGRFAGFCIVSSDSDFARLAVRVREQGLAVYGFGQRSTPRPFVAACDEFVYFDALQIPTKPPTVKIEPIKQPLAAKPAMKKPTPPKEVVAKLIEAVRASGDEQGRAPLSKVGAHLNSTTPNFDLRKHGFSRLSDLAKASGVVIVEPATEITKTMTVRLKASVK